MRLVELCEPLFQYVCRLNRSARKGAGIEPASVRADVKQILADMRATAASNPGLTSNYEKIELPLIYFVDQMIEESHLAFARDWAQQRLQTEMKGKTGGDEDFFDLLDETLKDQSEAATERLAVFYTCLGLGFTGFYQGQPEYLRTKMKEISARLRPMLGPDHVTRIVPTAYENVDTSDLIQPPGRSLVGLAVALVAVMIVVAVMNVWFYNAAAGDMRRAIEHIVDEGGHAATVEAEG
ncbi:MAG: hypothetical protein CMJ31_06470 [Phycisphaerae bacterium]|nr:hypothetical protein [Phycisphaerae bacterium]